MTFLSNIIVFLGSNISSPEWVADQLLGWLIFSLVVGAVFAGIDAWRERRAREPYRGWVLKIVGYGDKPQSLHWEEVERFENSDFELWKFVKSVASGSCFLKGRTIAGAREQGWVVVDNERREIVVNFEAIPQEDVDWQKNKPPSNWIGNRQLEQSEPTVYFVSGHPGARDWASRNGIQAVHIEHLDVNIIKAGDVVVGTLPIHLAAAICQRSARYLHLVMDMPKEGRQRNLSADEMDGFNARIEEFTVQAVAPRS